MTDGIYYTYIYYDPTRNNEPFYVGKGKDDRVFSTNRNAQVKGRIRKIQEAGHAYRIGIYAGMSEELALLTEEFFIWKYGRKDLKTGCLLNQTNGGEGSSGSIKSLVTRAKMSSSKKGKSRSLEAIAKTVASKIGKPRSPETRARLSAVNKGKTIQPATREKMSMAKKGQNLSPEHRAKMSASHKGIKRSAESLVKQKATRAANKLKKLQT